MGIRKAEQKTPYERLFLYGKVVRADMNSSRAAGQSERRKLGGTRAWAGLESVRG